MANGERVKVVLDKDTDLKFPNVLIIDASAGTGKTHTLTQRYVQYILSKRVPHNALDNILAITFTNNAAREMKQRVLAWLKKLALGIECEEKRQTLAIVALEPEEMRERARVAIDNIIEHWSDFHIQTIDSFMNRILRASASEIGIPLEVEITESYDVLTVSALNLVLKDIGDKISLKELERFLELLNQESNTFIWNPIPRIVKTFKEFLIEEGKALERIAFEDQSALIEEKFARIEEIYQRVLNLGLGGKIKKRVQEAMQKGDIKELIKEFDKESLWFNKRGRLTEDEIAACGDLPKVVEELTLLFSSSYYLHYRIFYEQFKMALNAEKRREGIIHFDDINKILSEYLNCDNIPEVYYHLGDTIYHFLLDEFQDTDRVQWENIQPLLSEAYAKGGSFFAVGDMKQAIYLFRKADYRIMKKIVQQIKFREYHDNPYLPPSVIDNARILSLEENFRSGDVILNYVDNIFKKRLKQIQDTILLKEDRTGLTNYLQETKRKGQGYVKTIIVNEGDEEPEKVLLFEILSDILKRYQPRDIAILALKNKQVEKIVEWLTERSIPTASFSSLNIKKRRIIMEIVSLLKFLDSPIDNLSFVNFVTGDVFLKAVKAKGREIRREDILSFIMSASRQNNLKENLYVYFRDNLEFNPLWEEFFEDLFNKVGYYPLYDLTCQLFRIFNIFENFKEETGFLVRFLEAISIMEGKGMNNIKDFIKLVAEEEGGILNVILPDYIDTVKVMTFHKAKGLGFPVVINMIYDRKEEGKYRFCEKENETLRVYYIPQDFKKNSPPLERIRSEKEEDELIQFLNLLYVANTRAMNELYNIVIKRENKYHNPCIDIFEEFEDGKKGAPLERREIPQKSTEIRFPEEYKIEFIEQKEEGWSIDRILETKRGEFFHEILAQISFVGDDIDKRLDEIIKLVSAKGRGTYDLEGVKKTILDFLGVEMVREWFKERPKRQVQREVEYTGEDGLLYRIDRVVIDPEVITVIDFKTGAEGIESYYTQLNDYIKILSKLNPQKESKGFLAFVETKKVVEIK